MQGLIVQIFFLIVSSIVLMLITNLMLINKFK